MIGIIIIIVVIVIVRRSGIGNRLLRICITRFAVLNDCVISRIRRFRFSGFGAVLIFIAISKEKKSNEIGTFT